MLSQARHEKATHPDPKMAYSTLRLLVTGEFPVEEHAENIASHMELRDDLMQDDPISEMRRIETLREMPQCLTVKRTIRAKLAISVNKKSKKKSLGYWKRLKYATSISFMKVQFLIFYCPSEYFEAAKGRKQIIFTGFWSKVLDFFYKWYIDSVCEDKALHQV